MKPPWKVTDLQDALTGTDHRQAVIPGRGWPEVISELAGAANVYGVIHEGETTAPQAVFWPMPIRQPLDPVYFDVGEDDQYLTGILGRREH